MSHVIADGPPPHTPEVELGDLETSNQAPSNATSVSDVQLPPPQPPAPAESRNASNRPAAVSNGQPNRIQSIDNLAFGRRRDPLNATWKNFATAVDIIGVPAIGGHPEKTWISRSVFSIEDLGAQSKLGNIHKVMLKMSPVSPAVSSAPTRSNTRPELEGTSKPPWIMRGIREHKGLHNARVLLYDHGTPESSDTLKLLANKLLENIAALRQLEDATRPLFFVCHSTGGLVVKMAFAEAQRSDRLRSIVGDCYGVTFFATPHRGSSYLSLPNFSTRIQEIMNLSRPIPLGIAQQLRLDHPLLQKIDANFKTLATDLSIWTFIETEDSDLSNPGIVESERFPFHAPITSIKSSMLNLRHEVVYPLLSDHTSCPTFSTDNEQTKASFLEDLAVAVAKACSLHETRHTEMNLENKVKVEIHGFYERKTVVLGGDDTLIVASTNRTLSDFLKIGPQQLLKDRAAEVTLPPRETQYLRHNTRATSIIPERLRDFRDDSSLPNKTRSGTRGFEQAISPSPLRHRRERSKERTSRPAVGTVVSSSTIPSVVVSTTGQVLEADTQDPIARGPLGIESPLPISRPSSLQSRGSNESSKSIQDNPEAGPESDFLAPVMRSRSRSADGHRNRRGSESAIDPSAPITFPQSDISKQRLVWIHVPFNNPTWVTSVLKRLSVDKARNCHERLLSAEHWESKHIRGRHSEHHACFLKPGCSFISPEITSPNLSPQKRGSKKDAAQLCLYLPYLHFDTYKSLVRRRELIKRRVKQGRSRPVPVDVAKLESLELKVAWQFLGHDPPINCRRTLDQYGYPSLLDTRARDDDQMLYKITKQRCANPNDEIDEYEQGRLSRRESRRDTFHPEETQTENERAKSQDSDASSESDVESDTDIIDGNVLMVDQLWLWIVDEETAVTFFAKKEALPTDGRLYQQADLRNSVFNEVNADLTSRCENSYDLSALVALHAVTVLFERSSHPDLEIFRTFEEAISILTEKMTTSFKRFRALGFKDKATEHDDALRTTNIRLKHKIEGALAEKRNRENTSALLELRDIEDELKTLQALFKEQEMAISLMMEVYSREDLKNLTANGLLFLQQAAHSIDEYKGQAKTMVQRVRDTRHDFDKLLQMVQRQAQVDEVRLARLQADLASAQSRSVMIFTVFTVIFLPLTFFTGLFGMNTREWGGGNFLTLHTIGLIALPTSVTIIALALTVAWSTHARRTFILTTTFSRKLLKRLRKRLTEMIVYVTIEGQRKGGKKKFLEEKREKRRKKKEARREASWLDMEDFWEGHAARRDKDYRIPPQNRVSVGRERWTMNVNQGRR